MAPTKTYPYLFYALAALCVVLLAPYAGCHIVTTKPHPESSAHVEDSVNMNQLASPEEDHSAPVEGEQSPSGPAAGDKLDDIERALNLE